LNDKGSINLEDVDSGCFKSVIPQSFVKKLNLESIPYKNCGFVANNVKVNIFGEAINAPFRYKNFFTSMSFLLYLGTIYFWKWIGLL
jgi:hypothetical protein